MKFKSLFFRKNKIFGISRYDILSGLIQIEKNKFSHKNIIKFKDKILLTTKLLPTKRKIIFRNNFEYSYSRNIPILNYILKHIDKDYDDIYICKHHIGEIYIFCQLLENYIKKNKSKNPILIVPEKRYISFYNMYCPNIKTIYLNLNLFKLDSQLVSDLTCYKNRRFFIPIADRFKKLRGLIFKTKGKIHFAKYIQNCMIGTVNTTIFKSPTLNYDIQKKITEYYKKINLNIEKYVIFSPEAVTATELSQTFWIKLGEFFAQNGYQIFINTTTCNHQNWMDVIPNSIKNCPSFDTFYYLAKKSKAIIGLISGLLVMLNEINVPRYFMYTNQTPTIGERMDADIMLDAYKLSAINNCNVNNLNEFSLNSICEKDLFNFITSDFLTKNKGL